MIKFDKSMFNWEPVESIPLEELVKTREQLHHAIQAIAAAGKYLIPNRSDDSHTSLHWNENDQAFEGESISLDPSLRVGLRPSDLSFYLTDSKSGIQSEFTLNNKTLGQGFSWMSEQLKNTGLDISDLNLKLHYEIPSKTFSPDQPFKISQPNYFNTLSLYYANATSILSAIKSVLPEASEIRLWPHHFDIATLLTLDKDKSAEEARSIGIGFSPGDEGYEEPYFYLTPWPYPRIQDINFPELSAGNWHTEGWVGAILSVSDIIHRRTSNGLLLIFLIAGFPHVHTYWYMIYRIPYYEFDYY